MTFSFRMSKSTRDWKKHSKDPGFSLANRSVFFRLIESIRPTVDSTAKKPTYSNNKPKIKDLVNIQIGDKSDLILENSQGKWWWTATPFILCFWWKIYFKDSVYNENQSRYGGYLEMAQKVIKRGMFRVILRWPISDGPQMAQLRLGRNLDHVSKPRDGSPFQSFRSKLRVLCMHTVCKNEPFQSFHTWCCVSLRFFHF